MNWVLGLIGLVLGLAISGEPWLLGAVLGFFALFFMGSLSKLRKRLGLVEKELAIARAKIAAQEARPAFGERPPAEVMEPAAGEQTPVAATGPVVASASVTQPEAEQAVAAPLAQPTADTTIETATPSPKLPGVEPVRRPPAPQPVPVEHTAYQPGAVEKFVSMVKDWFTEGNVPVKVGVLVLFAGVAAALRYAVAQGYFHLPIEVRLALIGAGGVAGLMFGWRERERRPLRPAGARGASASPATSRPSSAAPRSSRSGPTTAADSSAEPRWPTPPGPQ